MSSNPSLEPTAASYGKLHSLCVELTARVNDLQFYLGELERGGVCLWCGEGVNFKGMSMEAAVQWAREHDAQCLRNPLREQLVEAEKLILLSEQTNKDETLASSIDGYIARYGLKLTPDEDEKGSTETGLSTEAFVSAADYAVLAAEKDFLLENCEKWKALADQIRTDWIPANIQQAARLAEMTAERDALKSRAEALELQLGMRASGA